MKPLDEGDRGAAAGDAIGYLKDMLSRSLDA